MNKVFFYIDCLERLSFFSRFEVIEYEYVFVTFRLSVYIKSRFFGRKCILLSNEKDKLGKNDEQQHFLRMENTDLLQNRHGYNDARELYNALRSLVIKNKASINTFIIWNGSGSVGMSIRHLANEFGFKTIFLEISNLPNSIFADPIGVNAKSSIYKYSNKIRDYPPKSEFDLARWIREYEVYKSKPVPQAKRKNKLNLWYLLDVLYFYTIGVKEVKLSTKIKVIKNAASNLPVVEKKLNLSDSYVFLPLQVASDSQLILNSDYNNSDMIKYAAKFASESGLKLFVKVHPAETDFSYLKDIDYNNVFFSSNDTNELIKECDLVIVNNSTVGFEGLIYNKKVICLGRSFYSKLSSELIPNYISGYLINGVDYFSNDRVPKGKVYELLSRA